MELLVFAATAVVTLIAIWVAWRVFKALLRTFIIFAILTSALVFLSTAGRPYLETAAKTLGIGSQTTTARGTQ